MTQDRTEYLIARALCVAAGADETDRSEADDMLDLLIDRYTEQAQLMLHEFKSSQPAPHLRVLAK